jgi:predicted MFS family arabinose efflux permease
MPREPLFTRDFAFISAANVFQGLSFFLFIHLPRFLTDLEADEVEIGFIVGVTAIAAIVVRPTIGKIMDTRGRKPVLLVGGVANVAAALLYMTVNSLGVWIYAVRILHGMAEGAMFTSLFTYGADVVPASRRTEGLALFGVSGLIPMALGGLIGDVILSWADFDELFLVSAGFGALALAVAATLPERAPSIAGGARSTGFFSAIRQRSLLPIWLVTGVFSLVLTGYFTFLRTFVDEAGFGSVGVFFAAYAGTAIVLRLLFAWLPARVGEKKVLYPAFGSLVIGFVVLAGAGSGTEVALAGLLCGAGHGHAFPILFGFTVTRAPVGDRGSALAFFTSLFDVGTLTGGPLLGAIIAGFGYPQMYMTAAVILAAGVVAFAVWDRKYDSPRAAAA